MQELWMREDMRGCCIGAAYRPLLLIHSVVRPALARAMEGEPLPREGLAMQRLSSRALHYCGRGNGDTTIAKRNNTKAE